MVWPWSNSSTFSFHFYWRFGYNFTFIYSIPIWPVRELFKGLKKLRKIKRCTIPPLIWRTQWELNKFTNTSHVDYTGHSSVVNPYKTTPRQAALTSLKRKRKSTWQQTCPLWMTWEQPKKSFTWNSDIRASFTSVSQLWCLILVIYWFV